MKIPDRISLLLISILMDFLGYSSFAAPMVGEFADIGWAPLSAFLFYKFYGARFGKMGAFLHGMEELLPFTDFIPFWSIAWLVQTSRPERRLRVRKATIKN